MIPTERNRTRGTGLRGALAAAVVLLAGVVSGCVVVPVPGSSQAVASHDQRMGPVAFHLPDGRDWRALPDFGPIRLKNGQVGQLIGYGTLLSPGHTMFVRVRTMTAPEGGLPADALERVFADLRASFAQDPRVRAAHSLGSHEGVPAPAGSGIGTCSRDEMTGEDSVLRDQAQRPVLYHAAMMACESADRTLLLTAELSERGAADTLLPAASFSAEVEALFASLSVADPVAR